MPELDWLTCILNQLHSQKKVEEEPFESLFSFVATLNDRNDKQKVENLRQQQQIIESQKNLQDGNNELIEEKDKIINQLKSDVAERDQSITVLREQCRNLKDKLRQMDDAIKTLNDEYIALSLSNKSLETRYITAKKENEIYKQQILEIKKEDAERLNDENEKAILRKQGSIKRASLSETRSPNKDSAAAAIAAMAAQDWVIANSEEDIEVRQACKVPTSIQLQFEAHEGDCDAVCWFRRRGMNDYFLATGGSDRKVKLWTVSDLLQTAKCEQTLLGSNASITSIDIENDVLLASSNDMASRIWSLQDYKLKRTLTGHSNKVYSAKFLGVANQIASGSHDRCLKIWDINKNACIRTYFAGSSCHDLVYCSNIVISGHFDKKIRFWDIRLPKQEPIEEVILQAKITSLDISPDASMLLCSLRDDTVKVLHLRTKQVLSTCSAEGFKIGSDTTRAKFSADASLIGCGSIDGSIHIWNTSTSKLEKTLRSENGAATSTAVAWCNDRERLATIERSRKLTIWN